MEIPITESSACPKQAWNTSFDRIRESVNLTLELFELRFLTYQNSEETAAREDYAAILAGFAAAESELNIVRFVKKSI